MMFDRRLLENFNWVFLALALVLSLLGIFNLYSASSGFNSSGSPIFLKQVYWLLMGLAAAFILLFVDYHVVRDKAYSLYGLGLILLLMVLLFGQKTAGAQRWINVAGISFQPSEFIKILVVIALAAYFSRREYPKGLGLKDLFGPVLLVSLPFLLILKQPDLGTALHLAFACLSVLLFLKVRPSVLAALSLILSVSLPFAWSSLKEYQKQRIVTFLNPEQDPRGAGYHIIQSKIAVGSGRFWGKGFMEGTQSQLRFLPEKHTDFAFSVFAEEWGFAGCLVLLTLFFSLIVSGLNVVRHSQDRFGALLTLGLTALLFWQMIINISMVTGLMPVVGLPLPFISYGGSSLVTTFIAIGLILNISMRRFLFQKEA